MRIFKVHSLSNLQIYNIVLYIIFPEFIYPIIGSLYLLTTFTSFHHPSPQYNPLPTSYPLPLTVTYLIFVSTGVVFLDSTYRWDYTVFVFLCLSYFT